jgi:hypothetical protein
MAGKIVTNSVVLGDSATDTQNFCLKTNVDGTATFARGSAGNLGTVFGVNGSGVITGATITVAATAAPAFSAYRSSTSQSISSNTYVKVQLNTEDFDTNNNFDSTTNYRFTPTVAGYYQVNGGVSYGTAASGVAQLFLFKNGSLFKRGGGTPLNAASGLNLVISNIVYFNGSTDYVESYAFQNSGGSLNINGGADATYFNGSMVRSA